MASPGPSDDGGGDFTQNYFDNSAKFNPTTAVVIIVLIAGCFVLAFVSIVIRRRMRGDVPQSSVGPQSGTHTAKPRGLQKADVDALPLVHSADLSKEDHDHECPVCLMEFEPEETLRLLPACNHVFHQECIDAWFDSHSTCPLCRASLVGGDAVKPESAVPANDAVDTIVEVSENGDSSDTEVHGGVVQTLPQDSLAAVGPVVSREEERSSARGPLFRNSESFKRAARGVAAQESAVAAAEDEKNSSFTKPAPTTGSIRRTSSLSADLISLRNLLMRGDQNANANPTDPSSNSSLWTFARAKSLDLANRDRAVQNEYSREPPQDDWVTIDLQSGKAAAEGARISGESSSGSPAPSRSWSDRFSLTRLRSLKGIASLSRSTSDVSSRHSPQNLPI